MIYLVLFLLNWCGCQDIIGNGEEFHSFGTSEAENNEHIYNGLWSEKLKTKGKYCMKVFFFLFNEKSFLFLCQESWPRTHVD